MKNTFILLIFVLSFRIGLSQNTQTFFDKADVFFKKHVTNGRVDYKAINDAQKELNSILEIAKTISVSKSDANQYKAFWINAYNLAVIKGVIDIYPTKTPLVKGFFDKTTYELGGKKTTLNDIENKLLRAEFNDARFHFVLVCGALGCPPLINEAYRPAMLDKQLTRQTKLAINNPKFIKVKKNKIEVSEILKWYKEDFVTNGQSEIDFINVYKTEKIPANYKLGYYTYNWTLNAK